MAHHVKFSVSVHNRDDEGRMSISKSLGDFTHDETPVSRKSVTVDTSGPCYFGTGLNTNGWVFIMNNGTEDVIYYHYQEVGADTEFRIRPGTAFWGRMQTDSDYIKASSGEQPVEILALQPPTP